MELPVNSARIYTHPKARHREFQFGTCIYIYRSVASTSCKHKFKWFYWATVPRRNGRCTSQWSYLGYACNTLPILHMHSSIHVTAKNVPVFPYFDQFPQTYRWIIVLRHSPFRCDIDWYFSRNLLFTAKDERLWGFSIFLVIQIWRRRRNRFIRYRMTISIIFRFGLFLLFFFLRMI